MQATRAPRSQCQPMCRRLRGLEIASQSFVFFSFFRQTPFQSKHRVFNLVVWSVIFNHLCLSDTILVSWRVRLESPVWPLWCWRLFWERFILSMYALETGYACCSWIRRKGRQDTAGLLAVFGSNGLASFSSLTFEFNSGVSHSLLYNTGSTREAGSWAVAYFK